ncbi:tetratricopeptide repeat protein [Achromobacter mucicolens]|uniref:tetratricopeptide repeat protein n=1 Tax=Achromobacter mucicolens TaxID=1389922 RepID=UPI001F0BECB1|nr:hypothetical protein [Achromobacter mucicolens]
MKHPQQRSGKPAAFPCRLITAGADWRMGAAASCLAAAAWLTGPAAHAAGQDTAQAVSDTQAASAPDTPRTTRSLTLTLWDGQRADPAPNTPYRAFVTGKDDAILDTPSGDGILHGVTDGEGRTAPIRTTLPHAEDDFTLIRRIGDGPWGHFFQLHSSGSPEPLPGWPYIMTMHQRWGEAWVDLGYTNRQGATAYFSHDVPAGAISLHIDAQVTRNGPCFAELDAVNRAFARNDAEGARALIDGMRCTRSADQKLDLARLLLAAGQPGLARHWLLQARQRPFPDMFKPVDPGERRKRLEVARLLGMPDLVLQESNVLQDLAAGKRGARAAGAVDLANNTAYYLADFPDYLPQAEEQARRSLDRVGPHPYNQGTLGWILALRGQTADGLRLMHTAYRDLPRDEEMVADYGLALWRSGQRDQATRLWDEAQRECVWGVRMHTALREAGYPHPYFLPADSHAVNDYRARCAKPRIKAKTAGL